MGIAAYMFCLQLVQILSLGGVQTVADGYKSSFHKVDKEAIQGSILVPLLFTLYINVYFPTLHCNAHFHVDDTILYAIGATAH